MIKTFAIIILIAIGIPFMGLAQEFSLEDIPEPVTELVDTFSKVRVDIDVGGGSFLKRTLENIKDFFFTIVLTPGEFFSYVQGVWDNINNWLEDNIGVSFREIIRVVANFFVWSLRLIIRLIEWGISFV
ncbi:MAG: hypothetical protein KJI72_00430 [Patescibacteria group bacterium]|nr:hypothetical protein [Patescibacteria group bacterium]